MFDVTTLVVVILVLMRLVLAILGTVVLVIIVFVRFVWPVTDKTPVLRLLLLTVVKMLIPDILKVDEETFCDSKFVTVMLLVVRFVVKRLFVVKFDVTILVVVMFVKLALLDDIVVVIKLDVVTLLVFRFTFCILDDVKLTLNKFDVVVLVNIVVVLIIKLSLVTDVNDPFVAFIYVVPTDVAKILGAVRLIFDNIAADPLTLVRTKLEVVVLIDRD